MITGAGGQVGRFLTVEAARRGYDVQPLSRSEYDITDAAAAERHIQSGDVVVNCAAMTNVDAAEKDPVTAEAINAAGPATSPARARRPAPDWCTSRPTTSSVGTVGFPMRWGMRPGHWCVRAHQT